MLLVAIKLDLHGKTAKSWKEGQQFRPIFRHFLSKLGEDIFFLQQGGGVWQGGGESLLNSSLSVLELILLEKRLYKVTRHRTRQKQTQLSKYLKIFDTFVEYLKDQALGVLGEAIARHKSPKSPAICTPAHPPA